MENTSEINGIALTCNMQGVIEKIWHDDIGINKLEPLNHPFFHIIDAGSRKKALDFILNTKREMTSFGVQLNVNLAGNIRMFNFIGILTNDKILVLGAENTAETSNFMNHLQQINNEQVNTIRQLLKEKHLIKADEVRPEDSDDALYNEITRLNNEMANVQRQLTKKNMELDRVDQLKNRFLGVAAHDLRNPLNVIQSYADLLIEEAAEKLEGEHLEFLNRIIYSSDYMLKLIENLLDYSRIESGEMTINKERFDIIGLAKRVIELNNMLAARKYIKISLHTTIASQEFVADKQKMEQVFNNLLSNAVKFSYPDTEVQVKAEKRDNQLFVAVEDKGQGIKSGDINEIFVPFTTISKKGTGGEKGTGLGLSIVKMIVEAHQGKIWAQSEEGKGTSFMMLFPLRDS